MNNKIISYLLLMSFTSSIILPSNISAIENLWWNNSWSFRQEIVLPIDTNIKIAKNQPIDINVVFENPCWAKNEYEHSIRVIFENEEYFEELESQVYNLEFDKNNFISACNVVFLIPDKANGREHYFVYYDDQLKNPTNYEDHVSIEESYYFYEPIKGYPFESDYFKVIQDGYVVYAVSKKGEFMGHSTSQYLTKLIDNVIETIPKNGEVIASFEFGYYYEPTMKGFSSTSQKLVSDRVLVDGNLMVEFGIVSRSLRDDIQTTAFYKYYYCPTDYKRIQAHVKHNINQELVVAEDINTDGSYANLHCGGIKSKSISELNFGEILPYLHLFNEKGILNEYMLDPDPENIPNDYDIRVINVQDDVDLGSPPWVSFDNGEFGEAHSIIFGSTQIVKSGKDERDGLQLNSYEMDYPHFPGIETNRAVFEIGRNSYEIGGTHDILIPSDFEVEFDAEFFSTKNYGYKIIQQEAEIFQSLLKNKSNWEKNLLGDSNKSTKGYNVSIVVHNAYSFPFGAAFSGLTGRRFSYISAELLKDSKIIYFGSPVRFKFNSEERDTNNLNGIISTFFPIDWKNISFFKEITFGNIEPGTYLIKIYRENPFLRNSRKYIGFKIIKIEEDIKTHIFCKNEGEIIISLKDNNNFIVGSEIHLKDEDIIIAKNITDNLGQALLKAPVSQAYELEVLYNGFILFNETVKLSRANMLFPIKKNMDIQLFDFNLEVVDTWESPSIISLNPIFTSNQMKEPTYIYANKHSLKYYYFCNLTSANYQLTLQYKSLSVKENIEIPRQSEFKIIFPLEYIIKINALNNRGTGLADAKIIITRNQKQLNLISNQSGNTISLPPGIYNVKIYNENVLIGSRKINVLSERSFDFITNDSPSYPFVVSVFLIVLIISTSIFCYKRKNLLFFAKIISISFATSSILYPWWILQGESSQIATFTNLFLFPVRLVTTTTFMEVISGEIANLPDVFVIANSIVPLGILIGCVLMIVSIVINKSNKKIGLLLILTSLILLIISISIFTYTMTQLTEIGIGSFIGKENLEIKIPGEEMSETIFCGWGPSVGFYLCLLSIYSIILILFIISIKKVNS